MPVLGMVFCSANIRPHRANDPLFKTAVLKAKDIWRGLTGPRNEIEPEKTSDQWSVSALADDRGAIRYFRNYGRQIVSRKKQQQTRRRTPQTAAATYAVASEIACDAGFQAC